MNERLQIKQKLKDDLVHYAAKCLKVRTKVGSVEPFIFNKAQLYVHQKLEEQRRQTGKVRALLLKARQLGMSTYTGARFYHKTTWGYGRRTFIMAHSLDAVNNLYGMVQRFYEHTPESIKVPLIKSNAKELMFDWLDSSYKLGTAENKRVGRSDTIQYLHSSEFAFWNNADEHLKGIMQTVSDMEGTEIVIESTANGVGNLFHKMWQDAEAGLSEYIAIFVPWHWMDEYYKEPPLQFVANPDELELQQQYGLTNGQLLWRRQKIQELAINGQDGIKAFRQEYPNCIVSNQRVGTNWGIIPIEDVSFKDETINGQIVNKWDKGFQPVICLETELGYTLQCTLDHKISCGNDFLSANECVGQYIKLCSPKFASYTYSIAWRHLPCIESSVLISEDMGLFLGFFMGDGSYSNDTLSFAFNKNDLDCINLIETLVLDLFEMQLHYRETSPNGAELRGSNKKLREMFYTLGIAEERHGVTKRKICVPECIWRSPKEIVKEFLRGLFETDGFAGYKHAAVKLFSKHEQFMKDVQLLLLGFGITCRRTHVEKKNSQGFSYMGSELSLRSSEAREYGKQIGFVSERKSERVTQWLAEFDIGRPGKQIILQDKVKSLTDIGVRKVYDIEIADTHIFDANGFLVHNCSAEAFVLSGEDNYIPADLVTRARKTTDVEGYGPIIIGVDPARFGDDRSCIIYRQGRLVYGLKTYIKKDTMEMAGIVYQAILAAKPHKVCVDVGGLGAGVVDRLKELVSDPSIIVPVNFGGKPLDAVKYRNKKAEMWGEMLAWLNGEEPVQIPDSDELQADLCNTKYRVDSNSRLEMESKEHMKHRGVRSSDAADALCFVANTLIQTPKGQVPIQNLTIGDEVITPFGVTQIVKCWESETTSLTTVNFSNSSTLCGKGEHKVFTWQTGECRLDALQLTFEMEVYSVWRKLKWLMLKSLLITAKNSEFRALVDIINRTIGMRRTAFYIVAFGQITSVIYQKIMSFITKIITGATMIFPIWKLCIEQNISKCMPQNVSPTQNIEKKINWLYKKQSLKHQNGTNHQPELNGINSMVKNHGKIENKFFVTVKDVEKNLKPGCVMQDFALMPASKEGVIKDKKQTQESVLGAIKNFWRINIAKWHVVPSSVQTESVVMTKVYNLTLRKHNAYYANGILVFNCLTFALPDAAITASIERQQNEILSSLAQDFDMKRQSVLRTRR